MRARSTKSISFIALLGVLLGLFSLGVPAQRASAADEAASIDWGAFHAELGRGELDMVTKNAPVVWAAFKSAGFSDEVSAALMGVIAFESMFDPAIPNYSYSGGSLSTCFAISDCAIGIAQWLGGRKDSGLFGITGTPPAGMSEADAQAWADTNLTMENNMKYLIWELTNPESPEYLWWTGHQESGMGFMDSCSDSGVPSGPNPIGAGSPEEAMKSTKMAEVAVQYGRVFERFPDDQCHWGERWQAAEAVYKFFAGKTFGGVPGVTNEDGTVDENFVVKESELTGMKELIDLAKDQGIVDLSTVTLEGMDAYRVQNINDRMDAESVDEVAVARVALAVLGFLLMLYGLLILLAYLFDKSQSILEVHTLKAVTFGRWQVRQGSESDKRTLSVRGMVVIVVLIWVIGVLLASGTVYTWVRPLVEALT